MNEPELKRKSKMNNEVLKKNIYIFVVSFIFILGVSYGLTFFIKNAEVADDESIVAASIDEILPTSINLTNLSPLTDRDGINSTSIDLSITNNDNDGIMRLELEQSNGLELSSLRYGLFINNILVNIGNVPFDRILYETGLNKNETISVKLVLWVKENYDGVNTSFEGSLNTSLELTSLSAVNYLKSILDNNYSYGDTITNNYVSFDCDNGTCEDYRIVGIQNNRLVITKSTDLDNASSRVDSNLFNSSLDFHDNNGLVHSVSETDYKNLYLVKTTKIVGGNGTSSNPYILDKGIDRLDDYQVIGNITYNDGNSDVYTQPIFYNSNNYISYKLNNGFIKWNDNSDDYYYGDSVSFNSDVTLNAVFS